MELSESREETRFAITAKFLVPLLGMSYNRKWRVEFIGFTNLHLLYMSIKMITKSPVLEEVLWGCTIVQVTWVGQLHLSLLFTCVTPRLHIKTWSKREDMTIKMKENLDSSLHCVAGYLPHLNFWFSFCSSSSPSCWDATKSTYTFGSVPSSWLTHVLSLVPLRLPLFLAVLSTVWPTSVPPPLLWGKDTHQLGWKGGTTFQMSTNNLASFLIQPSRF